MADDKKQIQLLIGKNIIFIGIQNKNADTIAAFYQR